MSILSEEETIKICAHSISNFIKLFDYLKIYMEIFNISFKNIKENYTEFNNICIIAKASYTHYIKCKDLISKSPSIIIKKHCLKMRQKYKDDLIKLRTLYIQIIFNILKENDLYDNIPFVFYE